MDAGTFHEIGALAGTAEYGDDGEMKAFRHELDASEDPKALFEEICTRLDAVRSPFRTAERFNIEEIIDPRDASFIVRMGA